MAGIAAKSYCDALFEIAKEEKKLDVYKEQLCMVKDTIFDDPKCKMVMAHPKIKKDAKKELLDTIYRSEIEGFLMNFLKILVDKNRFMILPDISKEFIKQYNMEHNIQVVYVRSASALSRDNKAALQEALAAKLNKTIDLVCNVDEDLIAGIRIKINDQIIDNTALSRLTRLKKQVVESVDMTK